MGRPRRDASAGRRTRRRIDLALQGGGAHGAFTWGVLDRLLEDERLEIDAISGASAGAMNAVVLASGLADGGRAGAREALRRFWSRVAGVASAARVLSAPVAWSVDWLPGGLSPYQFNPFDLNPLRDILVAEVDFERLRATEGPRLYVAATRVSTGRLREFRRHELTADMVMASACLPMLYRAVEIDGDAYWDGGYVANPPMLPLIAESPAQDLLLVQINPALREDVPVTRGDIQHRIDEITFNASLLGELRTVALLKDLYEQAKPASPGALPELFRRIGALRLHRIHGRAELARLGAGSKLDASWPAVMRLHRVGREAADDWLARNRAHVGRRSTLPLAECT